MPTLQCWRCGRNLPTGSRYCDRCGAPQAARRPEADAQYRQTPTYSSTQPRANRRPSTVQGWLIAVCAIVPFSLGIAVSTRALHENPPQAPGPPTLAAQAPSPSAAAPEMPNGQAPSTPTVVAPQSQVADSDSPNTRPYRICIDPGHPSEVGRGTQGRRITEIHAAWIVALKLKADLERDGFQVMMTKASENQFVRNRKRAEIANDFQADYMVRLHCDSDAGSGIASYAPDRQGVSGGVRGPNNYVIALSQSMGRLFHKTMVKSLHHALIDRGFLPDTMTAVGGKQGALTGSVFSEVPVVLVELCVLTNPHDEDFIVREQNQDLLASSLESGIEAALLSRRESRHGHPPR